MDIQDRSPISILCNLGIYIWYFAVAVLKHDDEKQPVEEAVNIVRVQHGGKPWKQTAWQQDQGTRDHVRKQNKWEVGNCINSQSTILPPPHDVLPPARTHLWKVL